MSKLVTQIRTMQFLLRNIVVLAILSGSFTSLSAQNKPDSTFRRDIERMDKRMEQAARRIDSIARLNEERISRQLERLNYDSARRASDSIMQANLRRMRIEMDSARAESRRLRQRIKADTSPDESFSFGNMRINIGDNNEPDKEEEKEELKSFAAKGLLLDLGINTLLSEGNNLNLPEGAEDYDLKPIRSNNINLHIFKGGLRLVPRNHLSLVFGLTYTWNYYSFTGNAFPAPNADSTFMTNQADFVESTAAEPLDFGTNYLRVDYLSIPLELYLETEPDAEHNHTFRFAAGGQIGIRTYSKSKRETKDEETEIEVRDDFNLTRIRSGAIVRAGYDWLNFYLMYDLTPLYRKDKGPDFTNLAFGLQLRGFSW